MAGEVKIQGNVLILDIWDGAAWRPISCATSNTWSSSVDIRETETKCNPGVVEKAPGPVNNSFDVEGEYIDTTSVGGYTTQASHDYLQSVQNVKKSFRFSTGLADNPYQYVDGIISDLELTGDVNEVATFSCTMEADAVSTTEQTTKL